MNLNYVSAENKYQGIDFKIIKVVDAQYSKSIVPNENGNPFIEGLPEIVSKERLIRDSTQFIPDYDYEKVKFMSDSERSLKVQSLQNIRFPLPYLYQIYTVFTNALRTSYSIRTMFPANLNLTVKDVRETIKVKSISGNTGDPSNGFTLLGASGSGKTTSIMMMLDQFPQLIIHKNRSFGQFVQIVYLKVNCFPNSNLSVLLESIGKEIDKALHNSEPIYENEVRKAGSVAGKVNRVCRLIEAFSIGALILDEIQLLDFDANRQASFESILAISNNTKIAIIAVGTEDAYSRMFPNLRTSRRTGLRINAHDYCDDKEFFSTVLSGIWYYQWFDERIIEMPQEISEEFYLSSKGIIDQMVKTYIQIQLEYLKSKDRPTIDRNFVHEIVLKYYPGTFVHLKNSFMNSKTSDTEAILLTSREKQYFNELKSVLEITKQVYNDVSILNAIKVVFRRSPNADGKQIVSSAYKHLTRYKGSARTTAEKVKIKNEERREQLMETIQNLGED